MIWILASVLNILVDLAIDIVIYILIDVCTKIRLKTASDVEKPGIWRIEAIVICTAASIVLWQHHMPYMLLFLSAATFTYSLLLGRVDFQSLWRQLVTRWDEFQQHEASMEHYQELLSTHQARQALASIPVSFVQQQQQQQYAAGKSTAWPMTTSSNYNNSSGSVEPWYAAERTAQIALKQQQQSSNFLPPNITPTSHLRFGSYENSQRTSSPIYSSANMLSSVAMAGTRWTSPVFSRQQDYARRPLHWQQQPAVAAAARPSLKSRFMSALGMQLPDLIHPGLPNGGRQVCFLNALLQCLAHAPALSECLAHDCQSLCCTPLEANLVIATSNLLQMLNAKPEEDTPRLVHCDTLRTAASKLPHSPIVAPTAQQQQQDCGETFMWLVDTLHTALNVCRALGGDSRRGDQEKLRARYHNTSLEMLRFIYGDLNPIRVEELKTACRSDIETANLLDDDSYAEPIQRLADLEWLGYKAQNSSIIDDLFTGQQVESLRCTVCNKISVSIQTFNVLPVPIVEPRELSGLVCLEDCFAKFARLENLSGANGLRCECANKAVLQQLEDKQQRRRFTADTPLEASPVLGNGNIGGAAATGMNCESPLLQTVHRRRLTRLAHANSHTAADQSPAAAAAAAAVPAFSPIGGGVIRSPSMPQQQQEFRTSTPIHGSIGNAAAAAMMTSSPASWQVTDGQRRSLLRQLPECLVVQLMRFKVDASTRESSKLSLPVNIPLTQLDLTGYVIDSVLQREDLTSSAATLGGYRYDLMGLCAHVGASSLAHGHYVAFVKTRHCGWCRFDDEQVTQVNMQYELSTRQVRENAYLLFYRRTAAQ